LKELLILLKKKKKIWIDLDNTPHVPFFKPIIEKLEKNGYDIFITVRDRFQVCELADLYGLHYKRIGRLHGKNTIYKISSLIIRALQIIPTLLKEKPDLAMSHGSRSLLISAALLNIPALGILDYEHASYIPIFKSKWILTPEIILKEKIKHDDRFIYQYPGIKEDVYASGFSPKENIKKELGLNEQKVIIIIRPPAVEAHYHKQLSDELFKSSLNFLTNRKDTQIILLPRNEKQTDNIKKIWKKFFTDGKITIPQKTVDGLNLIWHSDLVISGGGTMNREAAALGAPVYSIFGGNIGAVDEYLSEKGRLTLLRSIDDIESKIVIQKRRIPKNISNHNSETLNSIVRSINSIMEQL